MTHPFHPLYGQQFEILTCRHNWGEYRVTFYQTPEHVRALPAAWTSLAPPDRSRVLAAGRAAFRVTDLLELSHLIQRIEAGRKEEVECSANFAANVKEIMPDISLLHIILTT